MGFFKVGGCVVSEAATNYVRNKHQEELDKMKRYYTPLVIFFGICAFAYLTTSTAQANSVYAFEHNHPRPDCVTCGWQAVCRACVSGGTGLSCITPDCGSCITSGRCGGGYGWVEGAKKQSSDSGKQASRRQVPKSKIKETITLETNLIREIAHVHPRFAATLANINAFGGFNSEFYRVHWTPVEISAGDIEAFLNRNASPVFFEQYNQKARELNKLIQKGLVEEIIYDLSIEDSDETSDANTQKIRLSMVNDHTKVKIDPPYSSLEITLRHELVGDGKSAVRIVRSVWNVN